MLVYIKHAEHIKDYQIKLFFNNNEKGVIDLKETIFKDPRSIFKPLRDVEYFKNFGMDSWTLVWPNEADFAPEFLYKLFKKNQVEVISN